MAMDKTKNAVAIFDKYAIEYQDKYMDVSRYADTLDVFCNLIEKDTSKILEVACGPGNLTRYLIQQRSNFQILGIDLSSKMIDLAKINNPSAEFRVMDCKKISDLTKTFDGISCGFCLPYLSKEEARQLITDAAKLLNKQGVLYLSTMEGDYSNSGLQGPSSGGSDTLFIHYHEADYLISYLKENKFMDLQIHRKKYLGEDGNLTTDLILLARK